MYFRIFYLNNIINRILVKLSYVIDYKIRYNILKIYFLVKNVR